MHRGKGMKFVGDSRVLDPSVRKKMGPKDYSEYPGKTEAFWPNFLLKEWMVGAVFLVGFLCLTAAHPAPLERIADPADAGYIPMPDWYFLFLYQMLKYSYASGPYNIIGLIIPGIAFVGLLLAPFIDRGPHRRPLKRPLATGFMLLSIAAVFYLTWEAAAHHDWEKAAEQGKIVAKADIDKSSEGYQIISKQSCITCHGENLVGSPAAPSLIGTGLSADEVAKIAKEGKGNMPANQFKGSDDELKKLSEFISGLKAE
ncbi:c-type cytochrome [Heyndrickxia oleronia]|uniref:Cytochrome C oxidase Cbb3 n=1 Tax=Heyndrickxia oleronia TaxID=38875 RepID=A0A8E2LES8_9BACI|nr:menaquinol-cytochrome c reductase cytochrome b/c subunit [Heyndrickxia oleronia]OJH18668.1 cytochrome C oxidase Cbb3 [Bacillus obstructivus]MCM3453493.1 c-type cytochrome [Heyndrickxia oleronia]MEC1374782.1 c-type cytochrome [Heyndrickxia oleronia]OOP67464.1 cytochrome C oxidase Cbb3 [Heyndrickxia oleronia]QQZ06783.1 c-type cytochrome [Heyndrickxia oleronia]